MVINQLIIKMKRNEIRNIYTIDPSFSRSRAPSKCDLSFCRSLKSFQPTNRASFHMSARTHVRGKMFRRRPREFPARHGTAWRQKKRRGLERVKRTRRMARVAASHRSKTTRCVACFFYVRSAFARRAHCRFLHSKDFLLVFFLL